MFAPSHAHVNSVHAYISKPFTFSFGHWEMYTYNPSQLLVLKSRLHPLIALGTKGTCHCAVMKCIKHCLVFTLALRNFTQHKLHVLHVTFLALIDPNIGSLNRQRCHGKMVKWFISDGSTIKYSKH